MRRAFTLIEMTIVVVIIGILAAALLPRLTSAKERVNNMRAVKDVSSIVTALDMYYLDTNTYPVSSTCNWTTKTKCTLSEVKDQLKEYLTSIPAGNNGNTGWTIGNGFVIPRGEDYGYIGTGKYYILSYIFTDTRDGQKYKSVRMPDGKWRMAENLNYKTNNSVCYDNIEAKCANGYGRLYDWNEAKNICPPGFHSSTNEERTIMLNSVESLFGGSQNHDQFATNGLYAAKDLMFVQVGSPGLDSLGFSAMTAGGYIWGGVYHGRDWYGMYRTSTESAGAGIQRFFSIWSVGVGHATDGKDRKRAVRCVRD